MTPAINLSYKLKLYPTANKADTLALLSDLFRRTHAGVTTRLADAEGVRLPSTQGLGEFIGRAYRRAFIDYQRARKAGHTPGFLKAELIDSAEVQQPRKAKGFDLWIMLRGTTTSRGKNGGFYIPANRHKGINRRAGIRAKGRAREQRAAEAQSQRPVLSELTRAQETALLGGVFCLLRHTHTHPRQRAAYTLCSSHWLSPAR